MKRIVLSVAAMLFLCGPVISEQRRATRPGTPAPPPPAAIVKADEARSPEADPRAKVVEYGDKDVVRLNTKIRYTTLIVLPKDERILEVTCGDQGLWVVNFTENYAYVKPAKTETETNVNLVTASGNVYSFVLREISALPEIAPDLKVFVEPKDEAALHVASSPPKFVSTQVIDDYKQQIEICKEETRQVKNAAQTAIDKGISQFLSNVRFPYRFEAGKKPFFVRAIYTDEKYTYLQARPEETPALYELKDGQPNLVNFQYKNGVYVVEKVMDQGYLAIGKEKLHFKRED